MNIKVYLKTWFLIFEKQYSPVYDTLFSDIIYRNKICRLNHKVKTGKCKTKNLPRAMRKAVQMSTALWNFISGKAWRNNNNCTW